MSRRDFLSARARTALSRHQREVVNNLRELQAVERVLSGALSACDAITHRESVETYLETIQELRVSLQRLEAFVLQKLTRPHTHADDDDVAAPDTDGVPVRSID